jgi:hypothetical protein
VRVRILKTSTGIVDGRSLSHLMPGLVYEVPVSLGMWLVSQGTAEEEVRSGVALADPLEHTSTVITGGVTVSIADLADDCEPRPRRSEKDP